MYIEERLIRQPKVLVESGLNNVQVLLMRPIYIENCIFLVLKQVVLNSDGLYRGTLLYFCYNHSLSTLLFLSVLSLVCIDLSYFTEIKLMRSCTEL